MYTAHEVVANQGCEASNVAVHYFEESESLDDLILGLLKYWPEDDCHQDRIYLVLGPDKKPVATVMAGEDGQMVVTVPNSGLYTYKARYHQNGPKMETWWTMRRTDIITTPTPTFSVNALKH